MSSQTLHDVLIELHVPDFETVKDFYSILGFEVCWKEKPKDMNGYLVLKRNQGVLCFFCGNEEVYKHPYFKKFSKDTVRGYGVELSIPVENIDEYYDDLIKKIPSDQIVEPLKMKPWGNKDFRIIDPFGYYLRINEPQQITEPLILGEKSYSS